MLRSNLLKVIVTVGLCSLGSAKAQESVAQSEPKPHPSAQAKVANWSPLVDGVTSIQVDQSNSEGVVQSSSRVEVRVVRDEKSQSPLIAVVYSVEERGSDVRGLQSHVGNMRKFLERDPEASEDSRKVEDLPNDADVSHLKLTLVSLYDVDGILAHLEDSGVLGRAMREQSGASRWNVVSHYRRAQIQDARNRFVTALEQLKDGKITDPAMVDEVAKGIAYSLIPSSGMDVSLNKAQKVDPYVLTRSFGIYPAGSMLSLSMPPSAIIPNQSASAASRSSSLFPTGGVLFYEGGGNRFALETMRQIPFLSDSTRGGSNSGGDAGKSPR